MKIEKMTKEELMEEYKRQSDYLRQKEDEFNLLKFLYQDYVMTMEEFRRVKADNEMMKCRIIDLQNLCDRQQKIIDSRCER